MSKKQIKIYERMLLAWFILAGLICLFAPESMANKLQFAFSRVFHRPLGICRNVALAAGKQQSPANVVDRSRYIGLRNHLANNIQWLRQEHQNVEKLSGLRNRFVWEGVNFVLADVITAFTGACRNEFIVNRGKDDGLAEGQFVLGNYGVIGTVSGLDSRVAMIRLVTDPKSRIPVKIGQSELNGVMQGNGNGSAKIQLLPKKYEVKVGDIVYVQKKPGFLDVPLIVGTIARCGDDGENPLLWDITVNPACDIQRLNSVAVIVMDSSK